jgi:hypothetical protein
VIAYSEKSQKFAQGFLGAKARASYPENCDRETAKLETGNL